MFALRRYASLRRLRVVLWLLVLAVCVLPAGARAAGNAYVANGDGTVSQYAIGAGGGLSPLTPPTVAGDVGAHGVAVTPDGKSAYVTGVGTVLQYSVDPLTGALSPKTPASVAAGLGAAGIAVTPDGKSAYVANAAVGTVSQYSIDPVSGKLSPKTPASAAAGPLPDAKFPQRVAVSPDGKSAHVTTDGPCPRPDCYFIPGGVSQYSIDPLSGALSPKTPATVNAAIPGGTFVYGIALTPDGENACVTNAQGVVQYVIDPLSGTLGAAGFFGPVESIFFTPQGIAVTPDGKSAYATSTISNNTLSNHISQFTIEPVSGALSPKTPATVATGGSPEAIAVTPDGASAYVTNASDNTVSQYSIDPLTGALSAKTPGTVTTGSGPVDIAVTTRRVPTSKDQCKNGGWRNYPQFKKQGQCVAFVVKQARAECLGERAKIGLVAFR